MKTEVYAKAPITEAALDIRVRGAADQLPEDLLSAADPAYPTLFQKPVMMQVHVEPDAEKLSSSARASNTLLGFAYKSLDEKQVYQFRTDGFTYNRLAPYTEWDDFSTEAKRLWNVYKNATRPETIELLGLNYINEIHLPPGADFTEYFRTYLEVSPELPQTLNAFSFSFQTTIPNEGGFLHVAQGYGTPKNETSIPLVLNIQAFKQVDLPLSEANVESYIWSTFESLRVAKSNAFEACITDKVREMIR